MVIDDCILSARAWRMGRSLDLPLRCGLREKWVIEAIWRFEFEL